MRQAGTWDFVAVLDKWLLLSHRIQRNYKELKAASCMPRWGTIKLKKTKNPTAFLRCHAKAGYCTCTLNIAPLNRTRPSFPLSLSNQEASLSLLFLSIRGQNNENHSHRKLTKLIIWTTALSNSMKLWAMPCRATQIRWVMVERSDKMWSTGEGNGKPLQYFCLENTMNSMKR